MSAANYYNHNGKNILIMDLSNVSNVDELSEKVEEIIAEVKRTSKPKSIYALLDLTNLAINKNTLPYMKMLSVNNGPYMRYVVFVGLNKIYSVFFKIMFKLTKRINHNVIKNREEALIWLVGK